MKRGFSPTRSKVLDEINVRQEQESTKRPMNRSADYNRYFCHYNNAVYMGGMSSYKKHGKGILFHDDGSSVITEYLHDTPSGHNIIFRENSVTSLNFKNSNEFEAAYKMGKYIIVIPFIDNTNYKANGIGLLIDYSKYQMHELLFRNGVVAQKNLILDKNSNEDVFHKKSYTKLLGVKHEQAFSLNFQKPKGVHIKSVANKTVIGFYDEDGQAHGLNFTLYAENLIANGERGLYLKAIQRGYYRSSRLQTYGEKIFSNGNKYIGEFQKGEFHGHGILIAAVQMKWVYGIFNKGKLINVIDSNNKNFTENNFQVWANSLRQIHKRYRERWIDFDIELPGQPYLYQKLKEALEKQVNFIVPDRTRLIQQEQITLSRIQQQFQTEVPGRINQSRVQRELDKHYQSRIKTPKGKGDLSERNSKYQQSQKPIITTPIHHIDRTSDTRRDSPFPEQEYLMEDPFKITLHKVPEESQYQKKEPFPKSIYQAEAQKQTPPSYSRYNTISSPYSGSRRYQPIGDGIYRDTYLDELKRQRERLNQIEYQDLAYSSRLRSGIQTSPIHRDYYSTPPKYVRNSPERYYGKITNKRHFNYEEPYLNPLTNKYPTTARYYPDKLHEDDGIFRKQSPMRQLRSSPMRNQQLRSSKLSPPRNSPRAMEGNRQFIKNNYKYWS